jgi:hypothetical protein
MVKVKKKMFVSHDINNIAKVRCLPEVCRFGDYGIGNRMVYIEQEDPKNYNIECFSRHPCFTII